MKSNKIMGKNMQTERKNLGILLLFIGLFLLISPEIASSIMGKTMTQFLGVLLMAFGVMEVA